MDAVLNGLWAALNSPAVIAALAGVLVWSLNRLYAAKPTWAKYEGFIVHAVRMAEKAIPDDTPNKAVAKIDHALNYMLRVFEAREGREATKAESLEMQDAIHAAHNALDAEGVLSAPEVVYKLHNDRDDGDPAAGQGGQ